MIRHTIAVATAAALLLAAGCSSSSTPKDPCAPEAIPAGLGCEFWPTVTANAVDGDLAFGIALTNPGSAAASVHVDGGALGAGLDLTVPAATSAYRTLPWVDALKACTATGAMCAGAAGSSVVARGGAYHVTSTQPIAAFQFSPALGAYDAGSADATALPPAHALGKSHVVVSWPGYDGGATVLPGLVAVTATADATTVQVTSTVPVPAGDVPAIAAGAETAVTLNRGDVLELLAATGDLTGTRVDSDKPVLVVGGHFCALVPAAVPYCDHLEEVIPPVTALGTSHVIVPPTPLLGAPIVVRVLSTAADTALSYAPAIPGAPATIGAAGGYADFMVSEPVLITSNAPVLVAEYMEGGSVGGAGDPSLAIAAPVARWRTSYVVEVPQIPGGGHVDVIAPAGASVRYDGAPLWFGPPDATGYVTNTIGFSGTLRLEGDRPFTVSTYGYDGSGAAWSYWYAPAFAP